MIKKGLLTGLALLLTSGCVSKDYVKEQVQSAKDYASIQAFQSELRAWNLEQELEKYKQKFSCCFDKEYDYDKRCIDGTQFNLEDLAGAVYEIQIFNFLKDKHGNEIKAPIITKGAGILLDNGYILTAKHIVNLKMIYNFPNGQTLEKQIMILGSEKTLPSLSW
ncbi:MAG: hypothetical protein KKA65_02350 [Nanoarchaeota archaeon]|nr:hypothetical protein [Nanoarchaeota archaeon]MBU4456317.1 hypothetical protein [Nanoarchaeota archaeon]MCG2720020.1 hypothetical protein [Nanoarchaeota archaeon]